MTRALLSLVLVVGCGSSPMGLPDAATQDAASDSTCAPEACNARDDDCDGRVDETFELDTDVEHCGACGNECDLDPGTTGVAVCRAGACVVDVCEDGMFNCDGIGANGCESGLRDVENCGECGLRCELFGGDASCATGVCDLTACRDGFDNCDFRVENGCEVALGEDVVHCGTCHNRCDRDVADATAVCRSGMCGVSCDPGFADCDGAVANGCEQDLGLVTGCGACGARCDDGELCSGDTRVGFSCIPPPCIDPPTRCDTSCVDTETSTSHCGGCDRACTEPPNAQPLCAGGVCGYACEEGFADCDGSRANGCEVYVAGGCSCESGCGGDVMRVGAGKGFTCALRADGSVACWGANDQGQLGDGTLTMRTLPVGVTGASSITQLSVGGSHSCALDAAGTVHCWGAGARGQLGEGSTSNRTTPVAAALAEPAIAVAAGADHTCAITASNAVWCWGSDDDGRIGGGGSSLLPRRLDIEGDAFVVAAGGSHTCVRAEDLECFGSNLYGQLGNDDDDEVELDGVSALSLGAGHSCALSRGEVRCWGRGTEGQLGDGARVDRDSPSDVVLDEGTFISAGGSHTCAISDAGQLSCWGDNSQGQLGWPDGTPSFARPVLIAAGIKLVTAGADHSCVLSGEARVSCVGNNATGQLGVGSTIPARELRPVIGL